MSLCCKKNALLWQIPMSPSILSQTYINASIYSTWINSYWCKAQEIPTWSFPLDQMTLSLTLVQIELLQDYPTYTKHPHIWRRLDQAESFTTFRSYQYQAWWLSWSSKTSYASHMGQKLLLLNKVSTCGHNWTDWTLLTWLTGFFELEEDNIVFLRATTASLTEIDDVAVCWVTGGYVHHSPQRQVCWGDLQPYPDCGWQDKTHQRLWHMPWRPERQNHQHTHKTKQKVVGWYCLRKKWLCEPRETKDKVLWCQELIRSSNKDHGAMCWLKADWSAWCWSCSDEANASQGTCIPHSYAKAFMTGPRLLLLSP